MKTKTVKFRRCSTLPAGDGDWWATSIRWPRPFLCGDALRNLVDLPKDVDTIWIKLSEEYIHGAWKLVRSTSNYKWKIDSNPKIYFALPTSFYLNGLGPSTLYAEVYYEE
jgi:hypothetical protein